MIKATDDAYDRLIDSVVHGLINSTLDLLQINTVYNKVLQSNAFLPRKPNFVVIFFLLVILVIFYRR